MGYLGLDATPVKDDGLLQRLFWPSDRAGEADQLGKQGFWVCLAIAFLSAVLLVLQGQLLTAVLVLLFYALGGIGIREHSQPAAILVAAAYTVDFLVSFFAHVQFPGLLTLLNLAACVVLIANIRGTWIAAKWARLAADEMPPRDGVDWQAQLRDRMPALVWPKARIPFFVLAGIYVGLIVLGSLMVASGRTPRAEASGRKSTSQRVTVRPSQ